MILIWSGWGFLVAVIWFCSILAGDSLARSFFGEDVSNGVKNLTGEWLASGLTFCLAIFLRSQRQEGDPRPKSSLFFIPIYFWPAIFFVLGVIVYFKAAKS